MEIAVEYDHNTEYGFLVIQGWLIPLEHSFVNKR